MSRNPLTRVLVVEDNEDDQQLLRRQLRSALLLEQVLFVSDPRVALDLLQGNPTIAQQLVALMIDVNLPHMSGMELLKIVRSIEGLEDIPVYVMTSSPSPQTLASCQNFRVEALLHKPVTLPAFIKEIANLFHLPPV